MFILDTCALHRSDSSFGLTINALRANEKEEGKIDRLSNYVASIFYIFN